MRACVRAEPPVPLITNLDALIRSGIAATCIFLRHASPSVMVDELHPRDKTPFVSGNSGVIYELDAREIFHLCKD